jgi:hypothetical protein
MKVWCGFGSEHSANLVMIGRFKDTSEATEAKEIIEQLSKQVEADEQAGLLRIGQRAERYSDAMLQLMGKIHVHSIAPQELEQFAYDVQIKVENNQVVLTTDEVDVSAFIKVLLDKGAYIEMYSAHEHQDSKYGRGK